MPGWHKATRDLVADGKLFLLGVTQEQHAERCRLFAQWKNFEWPILHDPINLLDSKVVPIVVAIDEHGIVRSTKPTHSWVRDEFVKTEYANDSNATIPKEFKQSKGDKAMLWKPEDPDAAVQAYSAALQENESASAHFRYGVALQARHDSSKRKPTDFEMATQHWAEALRIDPNQYIWRRRIQQYGPRLIKPYPFYDWVEKAQADIQKRNEKPVELRVALSGAEIAAPSKTFSVSDENVVSPDPKNQITRDMGEHISANVAVAPPYVKAGKNVRLHLELAPASKRVHWNNEAEPLRVWINSTEDVIPERTLVSFEEVPKQAESSERRKVEVEIQVNGKVGAKMIEGFVLYNICEEAGGQCLMRRQDFSIGVIVD